MQLATVYGGAPMYRQIQQLRRGVDVIIATPGRLQDLINQGEATLAEVVITVLDEADFMADLGFLPVVKELLDQTARDAQRLLFSATLDGEVDSLVRRYLKDPARHEVVRPAARPRRPSTWPSRWPSGTSCRWPPSWPPARAGRSSSPAPSSAWTGWPTT